MIIAADQLPRLFSAVNQDKHSSEDKSILVLVANGDVDSLCTCAQLESIFKRQDIVHVTVPVENYDEIRSICDMHHLDNAEDLKTVFFINCGAIEDIKRIYNFHHLVRIIILDSHRPVYHGYNTPDEQVIVVVDHDDPVPPQDIPRYDRELEEGDLEQGDLDDLEEEDEQEGSQQGPGEGASEDQDRGQGGGGRAGSPGEARGRRARGPAGIGEERPLKRSRSEQQQRQEYRQAKEVYYESKAGYGKPSALLLQSLLHSQQEEDNFSLWLSILGVTDQFAHQRVDPAQYTRWIDQLGEHVAQHNEGAPGDDTADQGDDGDIYNRKARQRLALRRVTDLRLPLLRHWTLMEAMQFTHHIATRMQTWREVGQKWLKSFLVNMNIPPKQFLGSYTRLHPEVVPRLKDKLPEKCLNYNLNAHVLTYEGFEMQYKHDMRYLAQDYVLAITAMLGKPRAEGLDARTIFREALDCLYPNRVLGIKALEDGLKRAKRLAQAVVEEGGLIITRCKVTGGRNNGFWLVDLSGWSLSHAKEFQHPSSLLRLALFIRDARAQRLQLVRPLVLVGPADTEGSCLVVAVRAQQQAGMMQNNPFSVFFQMALQDMGLSEHVSCATFDSAVYIVKKSAVATFTDELTAVVGANKAGEQDRRMVW